MASGSWAYDLVIDGVGGSTFSAAIERVAPRGLVVNLATGGPDEVVSVRATRFDRAPGARIYTLNLVDELPAMNVSVDLARLVGLLEQKKLVASVALEASWQDIDLAIEALLARTISGKAALSFNLAPGPAPAEARSRRPGPGSR